MMKSDESKMEADNKSKFRYFWNDLTNVKLIKTKFIWFTTLFGIVIIWPFLTLHMTSIGLSERDVGIASSLSAALTIISPFLFGFIADKIGNFKFLVSVLTFVTGLICLLFTVIPSTTGTTTTTSISSSNSTTNATLSQQDNDNYATTFWSYLFVRGMFVLCQGGSFTLYDGAVMSYMQEHNLDYGMQRAWGSLAAGISPFLGGLLKDIYGMQLLFCLSAAFYIITAAALLTIDIDFKKSSKSLWKEIFSQLITPEIIMLLLTVMVVGALVGYIETYLYIFLFGMGASNTLIGLTVAAGIPFEIIIQICATFIVEKIGHVNAILIGTFSCGLRLIGLSFLTNPWWVLPFEILEAMSMGLCSTSTIMYCTKLVTLTSLTSFRGLIGVVYWGIGRLLGSSIGTIAREHLGDRTTFRVMAGVALATTVIYFTSNQILKKYRRHQFSAQSELEIVSQKTTKDTEIEKGIDNPTWIDNYGNIY